MSAPLKKPEKIPSKDDLRAVLSYNIKILRIDKGWSQEYLANECELDRTYVSAVERLRWNVSLSNIERIATALSVEAWQLLKPPESEKK